MTDTTHHLATFSALVEQDRPTRLEERRVKLVLLLEGLVAVASSTMVDLLREVLGRRVSA